MNTKWGLYMIFRNTQQLRLLAYGHYHKRQINVNVIVTLMWQLVSFFSEYPPLNWMYHWCWRVHYIYMMIVHTIPDQTVPRFYCTVTRSTLLQSGIHVLSAGCLWLRKLRNQMGPRTGNRGHGWPFQNLEHLPLALLTGQHMRTHCAGVVIWWSAHWISKSWHRSCTTRFKQFKSNYWLLLNAMHIQV